MRKKFSNFSKCVIQVGQKNANVSIAYTIQTFPFWGSPCRPYGQKCCFHSSKILLQTINIATELITTVTNLETNKFITRKKEIILLIKLHLPLSKANKGKFPKLTNSVSTATNGDTMTIPAQIKNEVNNLLNLSGHKEHNATFAIKLVTLLLTVHPNIKMLSFELLHVIKFHHHTKLHQHKHSPPKEPPPPNLPHLHLHLLNHTLLVLPMFTLHMLPHLHTIIQGQFYLTLSLRQNGSHLHSSTIF